MYVPAQQSLSEWLQSSGAEAGQPAGIGSLAPARPSSAGGFPVGDALKLGKAAFQFAAPETYKAMTGWIPSLSDIGGALGLEGFGATGLGTAASGAMMAAGYAAPMLAFAKIMSAINQNVDGPIMLGGGYTSLEDGFYGGVGPKVGEAKGLSDLYRGDGGWYAGGDPSMVDDMNTAFGSRSRKKMIPYWSVGGAPYETPTLAVNSGRQIARQQMGLPVVEEDLSQYVIGNTLEHNLRYLENDPQNRRSLPVFDGAMQLPSDWNEWIDRANNSQYGWDGTGNSEAVSAWAPETIQAYAATLDPRSREWFDTRYTTNQMYAFTGPNSPDWELNEYLDAPDTTLERVAAANEVNAPPFNPFTYGMGPGRIFNPDRTNLRSGA